MLMMHAGAARAAAAGKCPGHGLPSLLHPLTPHPAAMHFHRSGTKQLLTACRALSAVGDKAMGLFLSRKPLFREQRPSHAVHLNSDTPY